MLGISVTVFDMVVLVEDGVVPIRTYITRSGSQDMVPVNVHHLLSNGVY